jgi:uncharacterized membrane protein
VPTSVTGRARALVPTLKTFSVISASLCSLFLLAGVRAADVPSDVRAESAVQVLAYQGDSLLNQGSGVVAGEKGVVVTNAHLLLKADKIIIRDSAGHDHTATVIRTDKPNDLAALRSDIEAAPVALSQRAAIQQDTLEIIGFWILSQEKPRNSWFSSSDRPRFVAETVPASRTTKALLNEIAENGAMQLVTSIGRGGYGAPVFNRCGQLVGLVRPKPGMSDEDLWKPHLPVGATAVDRNTLVEVLGGIGVTAKPAEERCLSVGEELAAEKQRAERDAAAQARKKQQQLERERQARKEAEADRDQVASELAEAKSDTSEIVSEIHKKVEQLDKDNTETAEKNQYLTWAITGGSAFGLIFIGGLMVKRRRDLGRAEKALEAATARFGDCRFEGTDSNGAPVAFFVLGQDLLQRTSGLLVGRNPDKVNVVIADDTVSREHARLFVENQRLHVEDLNSTGGTRLNGTPVTGTSAVAISGDVIEFGEVSLTLTIVAAVN